MLQSAKMIRTGLASYTNRNLERRRMMSRIAAADLNESCTYKLPPQEHHIIDFRSFYIGQIGRVTYQSSRLFLRCKELA